MDHDILAALSDASDAESAIGDDGGGRNAGLEELPRLRGSARDETGERARDETLEEVAGLTEEEVFGSAAAAHDAETRGGVVRTQSAEGAAWLIVEEALGLAAAARDDGTASGAAWGKAVEEAVGLTPEEASRVAAEAHERETAANATRSEAAEEAGWVTEAEEEEEATWLASAARDEETKGGAAWSEVAEAVARVIAEEATRMGASEQTGGEAVESASQEADAREKHGPRDEDAKARGSICEKARGDNGREGEAVDERRRSQCHDPLTALSDASEFTDEDSVSLRDGPFLRQREGSSRRVADAPRPAAAQVDDEASRVDVALSVAQQMPWGLPRKRMSDQLRRLKGMLARRSSSAQRERETIAKFWSKTCLARGERLSIHTGRLS